MDYDEAAELIKKHEGFRDRVYLDSENIPTCGYGHALIVGSYVPHYIADSFFHNDFKNAIADYGYFNFNVDSVRRAVILSMLFNLGRDRFAGFRKMIKALYDKDYERAAIEMFDSKWFRQVGSRAEELIKMMRTGEI